MLPRARCAPVAPQAEEGFFAHYDWCLNPILSLRQLFQRLQEELDRVPRWAARWQRDEARTNVYLLACAIACTVDDYLARQITDLSPISTHFPRARPAVAGAQWLLDRVQAVRAALADRSIVRWWRAWSHCLDRICELLVAEADPADAQWSELRVSIAALAPPSLPNRLLERRMLLPSAFRNQDLTHHDVATLARRVADSCPRAAHATVVIGLRTAGAYFAPLLKAHLAALGVPGASWIAIRPKRALSPWEHQRLRAIQRGSAHVVVVDEPPNSGKTLRLTLTLLERHGISADRITLAVPRNPAKPDWVLPAAAPGKSSPRLVALDPLEYHKVRLLEPGSIVSLLREYYGPDARITENPRVEELNERLRTHHRDGFHVRLKRVFEVELGGDRGHRTTTYVLAKSVGWGWLGYHAYIAGTRLAGFVPRVIGVRHGLMLTEWVGGLEAEREGGAEHVPVQTLASYVAARAKRLRLAEDPCFEDLAYGRTGWSEIINLLRRAYGLYVGRVKIPTLHRRLRKLVTPAPALIDGRVNPEEWVSNGTGTFKVDFEQHSFGKTELNVADPAYDLACATFAFGLSPELERQLVEAYARASDDRTVGDRILLYQLLHGAVVMENAVGRAAHDPSDARHEWNRRYITARGFLTSHLNRFAASRLRSPSAVMWSERLFFLDLDGVFDSEAFGFPHTTASGLAALDLLRAHGVSIVLDTGRSIAEVHSYCRDYRLPGGLAELGSVFADAVAGRDIALIDAEAADQLAPCREALRRLPGVFVDPSYRYSVRAYRYVNERTAPLPPEQVAEVLADAQLDRLDFVPSSVDTIILQRGVDKGRGLRAVREHLGCTDRPVAAIGDSDRDVPMLLAADFAYAPSGCSRAVRALGAAGKCRVMREPMQHGLLRAVRELVRRYPVEVCSEAAPPASMPDIMEALLRVAERPRLRQLLAALAWWKL